MNTHNTDWHNLYGKGWSGIITPESFGHPAKFSRGLIRHIYQHLFDEGWLQPGDTVLDPFGGVALGALHAMQRGLSWIGVELEQKFVDLGQQNIDLWNARFGPHLPNWGSAVLLQGDSRYLVEVVREAGGLIASPPYANQSLSFKHAGIDASKIASGNKETRASRAYRIADGYSTNPANLGNMAAGDPGDGRGVDAVIGSPPWIDAGVGGTKNVVNLNKQCVSKNRPDNIAPGQEASSVVGVEAHSRQVTAERVQTKIRYGISEGQIGNESSTTFWSAARLILQQCYQVLKVGAPAVWVVKSFVRKGKRVDFPGQWRQLCESCGFETVHEHRAYLTEDRGNVRALFGFEMENGDARIAVEAGSVMHRKGKELKSAELKRASFFRRLAERNARADKLWPTVSRDDRAAHLWRAHDQLWRQYRRRMAGDLLPSELPDDEPLPPTRTGILRNAKGMAYVEAGSPDIEIATQIDYEVVLCTVKR